MTKKERKLVSLAVSLALAAGTVPAAGAMHIMEGYLPPMMCAVWGVIVSKSAFPVSQWPEK